MNCRQFANEWPRPVNRKTSEVGVWNCPVWATKERVWTVSANWALVFRVKRANSFFCLSLSLGEGGRRPGEVSWPFCLLFVARQKVSRGLGRKPRKINKTFYPNALRVIIISYSWLRQAAKPIREIITLAHWQKFRTFVEQKIAQSVSMSWIKTLLKIFVPISRF